MTPTFSGAAAQLPDKETPQQLRSGCLMVSTRVGLVAAAVVLVGGLATGSLALSMLGALGAGVYVLAWLWARISRWRVLLDQRLEPAHVFPGESVRWTVTVRNAKPLPVRLHVSSPLLALSDEPQHGLLTTTLLAPWARRQTTVTLTPQRRGLYRYDAATAWVADPWGLFRCPVSGRGRGALWVYPKRYPVRGLPERRVDSSDGRPANLGLWRNRLYLAGWREGQTGSLRDIDWRASARRLQIIVKQYQAGREARPALLLHLDPPATAAEEETTELAISLAASLLWQHLLAGERLSFYTNAALAEEAAIGQLEDVRGLSALHRLLELLAGLDARRVQDWSQRLSVMQLNPAVATPLLVSNGRVPAALHHLSAQRATLVLLPAEGADGRPAEDAPAVTPRNPWTYRLEDDVLVCEPLAVTPSSPLAAGGNGRDG